MGKAKTVKMMQNIDDKRILGYNPRVIKMKGSVYVMKMVNYDEDGKMVDEKIENKKEDPNVINGVDVIEIKDRDLKTLNKTELQVFGKVFAEVELTMLMSKRAMIEQIESAIKAVEKKEAQEEIEEENTEF